MRPYRPSNQIPPLSLLLLLLVTVAASVAVGGILWAIEHFASIYLIVAFPIFAGAIVGGIMGFIVHRGKIRSPFIVMIFGLLAGIIIYGTYHFASYYVTFRGQVRDMLVEESGQTFTDQELDEFIDLVLQEEVGDTGILGFMRLNAQEGFTITRAASSSSSGIEIKNEFAWIYWVVEVVIASGMAIGLSRKEAAEPFDEATGEWYQAPVLIGTASAKSRKALVNALKDGDYQAAGKLLAPADRYPHLQLTTRRSPDPTAQDVILTVSQVQKKNGVSEILRGVLASSEVDLLCRSAANQQQFSGKFE